MTSTALAESPASKGGAAALGRALRHVGFLPALLIVLIVLLVLFEPRFMGMFNVFNVLRNSSALMIVASGQMLVLVVGGSICRSARSSPSPASSQPRSWR